MIYVNGSSAIFSLLTLVASGQLWPAVQFSIDYPAFLFDAFALSMCAMLGQQIIYYIIKAFGALVFATAMTSRQFIAILLSSILYGHPMSNGQIVGTIIVASAMYLKVYNKSKKVKQPKAPSLVEKIQSAVGEQKKSQLV